VGIIGAGVGGLAAAALLAQAGLEVCVLEAAPKPGGCLAGFNRSGFVFDTAVHWLNQSGPGGMVRRLLDCAGPDAPATPTMQRIRRYRGDGFDYLLTNDPDALLRSLSSDFPEDRAGLAAFFSAARNLGASFARMGVNIRAEQTMTLPERLRAVLRMTAAGLPFLRYAGAGADKGLRRFFRGPILDRMWRAESGLIACMMPVAWAYSGDFQRPAEGGSQRIPAWLAEVCRGAGGRISCGRKVERIVVEGGRAVALRYGTGEGRATEGEIRCRHVIAACDAESIYRRLLPAGTVSRSFCDRLASAEIYDSAVSVFIGLSSPAADLGIGEELVHITAGGLSRRDHTSGDPEKAEINLLVPSISDPGLAPPGKATLILHASASIGHNDTWKTGPGFERGEGYRELKQRFADTLVDRVERNLGVDLRSRIEVCEVATPITYRRYTGNRDGAMMGFRPSWRNLRSGLARRVTPIGNVLVGSQWAELGGGLPGALRAGANAAAIILKGERPEAFSKLRDALDGRVGSDA
jgi:prolycopene isomerase